MKVGIKNRMQNNAINENLKIEIFNPKLFKTLEIIKTITIQFYM